MPAKSRRKRSKNLPPSKRIKHSTGNISAVRTNQSSEHTVEATAAVVPPIVPIKKSTLQVQTESHRYPYISSELMTIGIFAVIVLVLLGILAAVL
jgi:hypothetical protein